MSAIWQRGKTQQQKRQENGQLREQCDDLSQQVQRLVEQVDHLSRLFITNSR
ncbi:MbeD/MobD family mobilization/exclusion protein [Escherichia coli]|uniref:MbeD/MobD family mobilization/exclusion protein n=1 Tax=Escherichia coli TaxID=562 RepID=UPI003EDF4DD1